MHFYVSSGQRLPRNRALSRACAPPLRHCAVWLAARDRGLLRCEHASSSRPWQWSCQENSAWASSETAWQWQRTSVAGRHLTSLPMASSSSRACLRTSSPSTVSISSPPFVFSSAAVVPSPIIFLYRPSRRCWRRSREEMRWASRSNMIGALVSLSSSNGVYLEARRRESR